MKSKKAIFFLFAFLSYIPVLAQVDTAWVRRYNGPANGQDEASVLVVDYSGNVFVSGRSNRGTSVDYATLKYSPQGDALWVRRYNEPGNFQDVPTASAVDSSGNLYVTGYSVGSGNYDYATIKYATNGDTMWVRRYNGTPDDNDYASALDVDGSGNVYVTGQSWSGTFSDYATIKYSPNGDTLWVRRYNGPGNGQDEATGLAVDDSGKVYVTGLSDGGGLNYDYVTIKYASNGDTLWMRRYNGLGDAFDGAIDLVVDDSGNVYVSGTSVGSSPSRDYATIKYSSAGDTRWVRRYNSPGNFSIDEASALVVDDSGNAYVTGRSEGNGTLYDYATVKYAPNGDTLWVRRYNGPENSNDEAQDLVFDGSGNVYVTGYSYDSATSFDYVTIKYAPNGDTLWVKRYNGPGNGSDAPFSIAVNGNGNVYVTGRDFGNGTLNDYATIKYVQFTCLAKPGDATGDDKVLLSDIVTIINFLFKSHPAPSPSCRADANADGQVLLTDIVYLINFIFKSGPAPQKSRECCL